MSNRSPAYRTESLPTWVWILTYLFLFWAGAYLMRYCGGFQCNVFDENAVTYGRGAEIKAISPPATNAPSATP